MKKPFIFTYILLILLTVVTALVSTSSAISKIAIFLIMGISAIKFLMVAFQFMELKKANSFWKIAVALVIIVIISLIILLH
ncbi:MAG: cytochrome C oxidase subunit IV family protein [Flavobacteriaceae bacterium]|nr:cytochrome C oxidase subunit IV family protein [Flavobacteriaceae bacterium]